MGGSRTSRSRAFSSIRYFDTNGQLFGAFSVRLGGNRGLSFLGVRFDAGERVARVRLASGERWFTDANCVVMERG